MSGSLTPMMQQYLQIKEQHRDALLFFRLGDFYELFFEDAITASKELEITLTGRDCGLEERAPMCGVPYHSVEGYIARLIEKGYKIAICEQLEDPSEAKGIVKRDVVRIITPGTLVETSMLDEKTNNYLVSLYKGQGYWGISIVDVSTGEFLISQVESDKLIDELTRIQPSEIIIEENIKSLEQELIELIEKNLNIYVTSYHSWAFDKDTSYKCLLRHFNVSSLEGYGCEHMTYGICAAGALIEYLSETQKNTLQHINRIQTYYLNKYMVLDFHTRRNLELVETMRSKQKKGSLLWLLDKTNTAMGGRLLKHWIQQPLTNPEEINKRLEAIEELTQKFNLMEQLKDNLNLVYDLERLASKVCYGSVNARDLISLKESVKVLPNIKELLEECTSVLLKEIYENLDPLEDIYSLIAESIIDDPPITIKEGNIIKDNFNDQLDYYRKALNEGKSWIASLELKEKKTTGIKTLKVGFNKVFGYYIEVTKSYLDKVPEHYIRKQTLVNAERYITPELKKVEDDILAAEEKSIKLEYEIFAEIRENIAKQVERIQDSAQKIALLDTLWSLSKVALDNGYIKPIVNNEGIIQINNGRHPVVEQTLLHEQFVPNDTYLDMDENRIMIITGPNMAGKSTYMRQVALIVLMAQIGSFVPAEEATIGVVDRIFTRVGASDDLAAGQSTFMVEMSEVANILNNATPNSLLILDEIGRGTSTFDGLSIAWAVVEYICESKNIGAKTLFATHYHELTELEGQYKGVKNYKIAVKEYGDDIIFLRKIMKGSADKSFGIQVAKLAGLPNPVVERAKIILEQLESADVHNVQKKKDIPNHQLTFFDSTPTKIEKILKKVDIVNITPLEALNILNELVEEVKIQNNKNNK
ncbi:MAG TPA: DNA mismatch repair protein MutS [Clostridiales bacterium]|nr:DNA mismatch repair protein MutS [Clostridiales bacterium]